MTMAQRNALFQKVLPTGLTKALSAKHAILCWNSFRTVLLFYTQLNPRDGKTLGSMHWCPQIPGKLLQRNSIEMINFESRYWKTLKTSAIGQVWTSADKFSKAPLACQVSSWARQSVPGDGKVARSMEIC